MKINQIKHSMLVHPVVFGVKLRDMGIKITERKFDGFYSADYLLRRIFP